MAAVGISLEHVTSLFIPFFLYCAVGELEKFALDQQVVYYICVHICICTDS